MKHPVRKLVLVVPPPAPQVPHPGEPAEPLSPEQARLAAKFAAARAYLGDRWVLHPRFATDKLRPGLLTVWLAGRVRK